MLQKIAFRPTAWAVTFITIAGCSEPIPDIGDTTSGGRASKLRSNGSLTVAEFLDRVRAAGRLTADHTIALRRTSATRVTGVEFQRYDFLYQSVPLEDGALSLWIDDGMVVGSQLILPPPPPSVVPTLTPVDAQQWAENQHARAHRRAYGPTYPSPPEPCRLLVRTREQQKRNGSTVPSTRLEYHCVVIAGFDTELVAVDAHNGALRARSPEVFLWAPATATGDNRELGTPTTFQAERLLPGTMHRLRSATSTTMNARGRPLKRVRSGIDYIQPTDAFTGPGVVEGAEVQFGIENAWTAYRDELSLEAFAGFYPSGSMIAYANVNLHNAGFIASSTTGHHLVFGTNPRFTGPDEVAHEVAHALAFAYNFNLDNFGEGGAINEGTADSLSQMASFWRSGSADFSTFGRKVLTSTVHPDVYKYYPWKPTTPVLKANDYGNIHHNSVVLSRWWALSSVGRTGVNSVGTAYDVKGVGHVLMANLLLDGLLTLPKNAGFPELRDATFESSRIACGEFSRARETTQAAWHAVGLATTPNILSGLMEPNINTTDVDPWAVRFIWQTHAIGAPESQWTLEVSTDDTFPAADTESVEVTTTATENQQTVGEHILGLHPTTTYFWRVRPSGTDPRFDCWRPTQEFTTGDPVPILVSPTLGPKFHPWELPFIVQVAEGTDQVQISVSTSPDMNSLIFPPKIFDVDPNGGWSLDQATEFNVLLDTDLFWTAIAYDNDTATQSQESAPMGFVTGDAQPTNTFPPTGGVVDPWDIQHTWSEVRGAVRYTGEVRYGANQRIIDVPAPDTIKSISYPAYTNLDVRHWQVRAVGPPLGTLDNPEPDTSREVSPPSYEWTYLLDFSQKEVTITYPKWNPNTKACMDIGNSMLLQWDGVSEAESYRFEFYGVRDVNTGTQAPNDSWNDTSPNAEVTVAGPMVSTMVNGVPTQRLGPENIGYAVRGIAYGPDGVIGPETQSSWDLGLYFFKPTVPVTLDPTTVSQPWTPNWLHMAWTTDYAERGQYRVEIYNNSSCSGAPYDVRNIDSFVSGTTAFEQATGPGSFSWRVRPRYDGHCGTVVFQWSACKPANVAPPPPPPVPTSVLPVQGTTLAGGWLPVPNGQLYVVFAASEGAASYRIQRRTVGSNNVIQFVRGEGYLLNEKQQLLDAMCAANPQDSQCPADALTFMPGQLIAVVTSAPPNQEVRVQACNNNGNCSDFSAWDTGI